MVKISLMEQLHAAVVWATVITTECTNYDKVAYNYEYAQKTCLAKSITTELLYSMWYKSYSTASKHFLKKMIDRENDR